MTAGTRLQRVREIAGVVLETMAVVVLAATTALAAVLLVGTIHILYQIW